MAHNPHPNTPRCACCSCCPCCPCRQVQVVYDTEVLDGYVAEYQKLSEQLRDLVDQYIRLKRRGKELKAAKVCFPAFISMLLLPACGY